MSDNKPLVVERTLNAPIDKVWKALTDYEELKVWSSFLPKFEPTVGFKYQFELGKIGDKPFLHLCEVLEVVEQKKLSCSWRYDGYPGDSVQTYELEADGDQTKLKLTWSGLETFPQDVFKPEGFKEGGNFYLDALVKYLQDKKS